MPRTTLQDVIRSLPANRWRIDSPLTVVLYRPLSFIAAWLFLSLGWSANAVTYISVIFCVAGFGFLAAGPLWAAWVGLAAFVVFSVLDCADGNVARVNKTASPWGEWVDAFGGYAAYTTLLLGAGAAAEARSPGSLPGIPGVVLPWVGGWVLVGAVAAGANLFMRAIYQARRAIRADPGRASVSREKRVSEYLGITGALIPLLALGLGLGFLPWVVVAYGVFYGGSCLLVSVKLVRQVQSEVRGGS